MNLVCVAPLRLAVVVLGGTLLAACEATTFPEEPGPEESAGFVEALGTQTAELQANSSYIDLDRRLGPASALGNTCGAANQVSSICGNSGGAPDYNFKWMAPRSGNFTFTTEASGFDAVLQLSQWGNGVSMGCNDNAIGAQSSITLYVPVGGTIRVTVDGANSGCGPFQLNITEAAANCGTYFCGPATGPCSQGFGTCSNGSCVYPPSEPGTACNDGNACTTGDYCTAGGACVGNAVACNSPPGQCYQSTGTCSGSGCSYAPSPQGTACNDGNSCTSGDYCNGSGSCISGNNTCCGVGYIACNGECCRKNYEFCNGEYCEPLSTCVNASAAGGGDDNIEYCP